MFQLSETVKEEQIKEKKEKAWDPLDLLPPLCPSISADSSFPKAPIPTTPATSATLQVSAGPPTTPIQISPSPQACPVPWMNHLGHPSPAPWMRYLIKILGENGLLGKKVEMEVKDIRGLACFHCGRYLWEELKGG